VHLGHSRIAYINGLSGVFSAGQRFLGFIEEMRSQKMTVPDSYIRQIQIGPIVSQGRQEVRDLLALKPSPSAVLCSHDFIARNIMEEATKMGVRIPEDLAVVGFDDNPLAAHLDPPLTTVRQPVEAEGRLAVQLLLDKIDRKLLGERQEFLLCKLVIRRSCGSPYQPVEQEKRGIESCALTH
jgi:LacI family transcriptional regulator